MKFREEQVTIPSETWDRGKPLPSAGAQRTRGTGISKLPVPGIAFGEQRQAIELADIDRFRAIARDPMLVVISQRNPFPFSCR